MYAALNDEQKLINAIECNGQERYFCPRCKLPVKLIFTSETPFFRHENKIDNDTNERDIHKQGKSLIIEILKKLSYPNIESEVYLNKISQRPDILIDKKTVVEYQCAKIDVNKLSKRVKSYYDSDLENIWILGGDYLQKNITKAHLKFISYNVFWGFYVVMLDPINEEFQLFYQIRFNGPFSKISSGKRIFKASEVTKLLNFKPHLRPSKKLAITDVQVERIQRLNSRKFKNFKIAYYQRNEITVEKFLIGKLFTACKPIYQNPQWAVTCGMENKRLHQPLLDKKRR
ncbi:competence protein CoiA family protein [Companilactobacillus mishanensis]|uniref:Competence protein CoiA nuclease-like domain-containing protein n=1 Tax=Companilactobacillus mishanensis TaxID=2486008 RepID=A0A5P0ZFQ5_9LACO|nr:competence protein CoiA family protein [Companilactobacillus mishanensis]MQS51872.1 hypothetical protein [Companilactobacillus mishanensis]